jgi:hypothetical protein
VKPMDEIQRLIIFGKKKIGKTHRRFIDVMRIYLSQPVRKVKPYFEARIGKETTKLALDWFKAKYEDKGEFLVVSGVDVDEKIRRLIVFSGVRQAVDEGLGKLLLELVASMNEVEVLFWFSRFINTYQNGGYWDVYRVAKSFRILYRIESK